MLSDLPIPILSDILTFLPQSDVVSTALSCKKLHSVSLERLYKRICIRKDPVYHSDLWYIDCSWTTVSGYRALHKREDQNDYIIHLKLDNLIRTLQNTTYGSLIQQVVFLDEVFHFEDSYEQLRQLVSILKEKAINIEVLDAPESILGATSILSLTNIVTDDIDKITNTNHLQSLTIKLHSNSEERVPKSLRSFESLKELILVDEESASLRILKILS